MSWRKVKLGDFLIRSKIPVDIEDDKDYKRVTIRINHNGVSLRDVAKGINIGTKKQFILKEGQFALSKIDARYGAFGIAPNDVDGAIITGNFWAYDFDKQQINIDWLNQYTNSAIFYEICERASSGITHRKYLDEVAFLNHEVLIPDADEQKVVIEAVLKLKSTFNNLSYEISNQQDILKHIRQAVLSEAIQGKLVQQSPDDEPASELLKRIKLEKEQLISQGKLKKEKPLPQIKPEEIPFKIPKNWIWCRLGEVTLSSEAGKSFKCEEIPIISNEWGVIKVSAVSWDRFKENENKVYSKEIPNDLSAKIEKGDFIISRANTVDLVGKSVVVKEISKNLLLSDKTIRFKFSNWTSQDYMNICNNSKHSRVYYSIMGTGTSPSMKNITRDHMKNLIIPLPPSKEQTRIVEKVNQILSTCSELEQNIQQNQQYTQQLMQVALKEALSE